MKEKERFALGDIGMLEDTFELVKNLVSIESHAFGSYISTQEDKWLKISMKARELRTKYLSMITSRQAGQSWCISKHISECCMRLQEVYTRFLSTNQIEEAKICAEDYFSLYYLFLELNGVDTKNVKTISSA